MGTGAGRAWRRNPAGITLVELLIVFALLATLAAVLAPILMPSPARTLRGAASEIATTLRETRRQAQAVQTPQRFMLDTETGTFGIQGAGGWRPLPEGVAVALTTAESLVVDPRRGGIDFFPDGSSTGGRLSLALAEHSVRVDIEWLTGRIRVAEGAP